MNNAASKINKAIGDKFARSFTYPSFCSWLSDIIPIQNTGTANYSRFIGHMVKHLLPPLSKCKSSREIALCASKTFPVILSKYHEDTIEVCFTALVCDLSKSYFDSAGTIPNAENTMKETGAMMDIISLCNQFLAIKNETE